RRSRRLLQKNVLDRRRWATRDQLHDAYRALDRTHLQQAPTPTRPRQAHPSRIRTRIHHPQRRTCGMITTHPVSTEPAAVPVQHGPLSPHFATRPTYTALCNTATASRLGTASRSAPIAGVPECGESA